MLTYAQIAKTKRECLGLSQTKFAEKVGVSSSTINNFEMGREVTEMVLKAIKFTLRQLEDELSPLDYAKYNLQKECTLCILESDSRLISDRVDTVMMAALRIRTTLKRMGKGQ